MNVDVLVAVVGGIASIIVSIIGVFVAYIKLKTDTSATNAQLEAEERTQFRKELREEISRLREIIHEQNTEIDKLEKELDQARDECNIISLDRDTIKRHHNL
jgi:uncharacterized membrane protein